MSETVGSPAWRRLAVGSFVTLVLAIVGWNAAAYAIDSSSLDQGADSWGMAFGSVIASVIYGGPFLVLSLTAAITSGFGSPRTVRVSAWAAAVLAALCGLGLMVVAALTVTGTQAEVVFAVVSLLLGLVLLVPVVRCVRHSRSHELPV